MNRALWLTLLLGSSAFAQVPDGDQLFRQLEDELATPTSTRAASGAPGHRYWQQRVDYVIDATLDEDRHRVSYNAVYNPRTWATELNHTVDGVPPPDVRGGNGIENRDNYDPFDMNRLGLPKVL